MSQQLLQKLWYELADARRRLVKTLLEAYGADLHLLLPGALSFVKLEPHDFELRRLLLTLARTIEEAGPVPSGEYRFPMTRNLLSLLICEHGWVPGQLPLLPNGLPAGSAADDALQRVRDLREELAVQKELFRVKARSTPAPQQQL